MANLKIKFEVKDGFFKKIGRNILNIFGRRARNNFADFRPFIKRAINDTVEMHKHSFIPLPGEAAELGIGEGGSIDYDKINNAYKELREEGPATSFSINAKRGNAARKVKIGTIRVNIDEETFLDAEVSKVEADIVENGQSVGKWTIPWMRWYIYGEGISGHQFKKPFTTTEKAVSRTGEGIMIIGGMWEFSPHGGEFVFVDLIDDIERRIRREVKKNFGRIIE